MSNYFITSDEHYGHDRILTLAKRPFKDVIEMRETLISNHNRVVPDSKGFTTIHVGDMFWNTLTAAEAMMILSRLHGRHIFIYGNHDELIERTPILASMFDEVIGSNEAGGAKVIHFNKRALYLSHYAARVWPKSHKGSWHGFGHSHSGLPGLGKSFDIGVDGHNFTPWSLEEIEAKMSTLTQHHYIDNTGRTDRDVVEEPKVSRFDQLWP